MQHTTTEVCDRPQASWYYSRGPRPTRTVSARHHFHGSNSFFSRLPNWSFRSLTHRRKRSPSLHDPVYTDAPHAYVVEETYRTLSPTEHEDVTQASQYVADEGSRPLIQVEALQHQLAALRESNRTLSRDITDQAQELSTVRKQYMQQTAEVAKLSEQYDAIRQSSDSAAVELAAARKQLSMAKAEAGLAASDRIDLMKENSHLRQEYTQAMAHIAALQQDLGKLRSVQKDFDQATAALERSRQIHAVDREQIMRMEEELKAFSENEKQIMLIQREAEVARRQSSKLLKELHEAQEAIKAFQEVSERNSWLEEERRRLLPFETECDRMRARLVLEENRIKEITEKHAETIMQLNTVMAEKKSLRHEIEKQANEIVVLAADLRSANQRDSQKAEQLRLAIEEARRFEYEAQRRLEEVARLESENVKITKELESDSKKHLEDLTDSLAEKQKLKMELDAATDHSQRLSIELQLMKETEWRQAEALRRAREESSALSSRVQELLRQAESIKESHQLQAAEFEATVAAMEQQSKNQETSLLRTQCLNEELEATLDALRKELKHKDSTEKEILHRVRLELQETQQQHEAAVSKKRQLRTQLMEATRTLHLTRVRNEELCSRLEEAKKQCALTAADGAAKEKEWAEKFAQMEAKMKDVQRHYEVEVAKRQRDTLELSGQQQELANCKKLLQSLQLTQRQLEDSCRKKDAEIAACKAEAQRESAERAEAEAAWARTVEEEVQQRVSILEKDFALRIAKIRKKVAERAEYNHLLDELLAAERSIMRRWREGMDLWRKAVATSLTRQ